MQYCDFYASILAFWVTLIAIAEVPLQYVSCCHIFGALSIAYGVESDKTGLTSLFPLAIGLLITVLKNFIWLYVYYWLIMKCKYIFFILDYLAMYLCLSVYKNKENCVARQNFQAHNWIFTCRIWSFNIFHCGNGIELPGISINFFWLYDFLMQLKYFFSTSIAFGIQSLPYLCFSYCHKKEWKEFGVI